MPLVSPSRDGEIVTQIVLRWGYRVSRGSSSHSIIRAWFEMKRELEAGGEVLIVPDGPRGPARARPKAPLAQQTGAPLIPFTFSASKTKVLASGTSSFSSNRLPGSVRSSASPSLSTPPSAATP
jgi:lysophospholipid acyltransferase (LPLAT)-like uncharacterized protein